MLYNRDLSWLGFNDRVLQEAECDRVPLYERMKFLAIFSSNLDEFFRVRYPAVLALSKLDKKTIKREFLLSKEEVTENIYDYINGQLARFGKVLDGEILPALEFGGVDFYYNKAIPEILHTEARTIFLSKILSFIQPVYLGGEDSGNFTPENGKLYFVVTLLNTEKDSVNHVVVNIPSDKLKRFFTLQEQEGKHQVVFLDDIIRENLPILFPRQQIESVYSIKFNRDAALTISDDYTANLLDKIEKKLSSRDWGNASRFLYQQGMPSHLQMYLASIFSLTVNEMFEGGRYHNLSDLFSFPVFDKALLYESEAPILYPKAAAEGDIFKIVAQQDILLHLPYHSYTPVLTFFNQAAVDVDVTDIYITLYRVASESHIVNALISAAKNGKKVTAFIELKARFDEANNIKWSRVMKKAGVKLIYSKASIKVHSKIGLIKKVSNGKRETYAILSTGNFNESTASFYTDHVLLTANKKVCKEMQSLFKFLQKKKTSADSVHLKFDYLYVAQFNLVPEFEKLVRKEIDKAHEGKPALIRIKVNNLEEPYFINLLYEASKEGVKIDMLVRSICCLIPGRKPFSENITVKRIVDKYLEHTRLFIFGTDEEATVIMGSSDLMTRNLRKRIEVCIRLDARHCKQQILNYFSLQWQDNTKVRILQEDMSQVKDNTSAEQHNAQNAIYTYLKAAYHD